MDFEITSFAKIIPKPWGHEVLYTGENLPFTGKIMVVNAGKRWSLHYHDKKLETLCLFSGKAVIWLQDERGEIQKIPMQEKHGYTVRPGQIHRIVALEDSIIIEASEPESGTTVRVEDDFQRGDENEEIRKLDDRGGWKE